MSGVDVGPVAAVAVGIGLTSSFILTPADRLETAEGKGAEIINSNTENPVTAIHRLTKGVGAERAIDAVGVDANQPHQGLMAWLPTAEKSRHKKEVAEVAAK
jgi:threonine dehydrogenase-like Zn-dependent dehydrogenase